MTCAEKIAKIEEIMELDPGELALETRLVDYVEWDSISKLAFVSLVEETTGKMLSAEDVQKIVSVQDAAVLMG